MNTIYSSKPIRKEEIRADTTQQTDRAVFALLMMECVYAMYVFEQWILNSLRGGERERE